MSIEIIITCNVCCQKKIPIEVKGYSVVLEEDSEEDKRILITDNWKGAEKHICRKCIEEIKKIVL